MALCTNLQYNNNLLLLGLGYKDNLINNYLSLISTFDITTATFSRSQNSWMSIDQNVLSIAYQAGTNWQLTYKYILYIYYNIIHVLKIIIFVNLIVICDVHLCHVVQHVHIHTYIHVCTTHQMYVYTDLQYFKRSIWRCEKFE